MCSLWAATRKQRKSSLCLHQLRKLLGGWTPNCDRRLPSLLWEKQVFQLCVYVSVCLCVCECDCPCIQMWSLGDGCWRLPPSLSTSFLEAEFYTVFGARDSCSLGWEAQGSSCLCLPALRLQSCIYFPSFLCVAGDLSPGPDFTN